MKKFLPICFALFYLMALVPVVVNAQATPARILISPATGTVSANPNFTVDVNVDTGGSQSAGADVIVLFDTTKLQFISGEYPDSATFYPNNRVVYPITASSAGEIVMARLVSAPGSGSPVYTSGVGTFAKLTFKPLVAVGAHVALTIKYTSGATTDSNVAGTTGGVDLLGGVTNADLIIGSGPAVGPLDRVEITPSPATVVTGATQSFTATPKDSNGNTISTGITFAWTETGDGTVAPTSANPTTYTAGATAGTGTITVTATQGTGATMITKTATANITITGGGPFIPNPSGTSPFITSISPTSGSKSATPQVTIYGGNFGNFEASKNKVHFGMNEATILDWSNTRIVVRVPASPDLTSALTVTVRVTTAEAKTAEFLGYTYTMAGGKLPENGPETFTWIGMLMSSFGMAGLAYLKLATKKPVEVEPIQLG